MVPIARRHRSSTPPLQATTRLVTDYSLYSVKCTPAEDLGWKQYFVLPHMLSVRLFSHFTLLAPFTSPLPGRSQLESPVWGPGPTCQRTAWTYHAHSMDAYSRNKMQFHTYTSPKLSSGRSSHRCADPFLTHWIPGSESRREVLIGMRHPGQYFLTHLTPQQPTCIIRHITSWNRTPPWTWPALTRPLSIPVGHWHTESLLSSESIII